MTSLYKDPSKKYTFLHIEFLTLKNRGDVNETKKMGKMSEMRSNQNGLAKVWDV